MRRTKILLLFALLFFIVSLVSCQGTNTDTPTKADVVSIEQMTTSGENDTYVIIFTDGTRYEFSIADENEKKSAYDLYKSHCSSYQGNYESWVDDLINGMFSKDFNENVSLVTITVWDEEGLPIVDALIEVNGYKYLTQSTGECKFAIENEVFTYTVSKSGFDSITNTMTREEVVNSNGKINISITLSSVQVLDGYQVRSDNYVSYKIKSCANTAYYYWYITYEEDGVRLLVDVIDDEIYTNNLTIGMNDNIEFTMQKNSTTTYLSAYNSFNVQVTLGSEDQNWARYAMNKTEYATNIYNDLISSNNLSILKFSKSKDVDGFDGVSINMFIDYSVWDISYEQAKDNMTILIGGRNADSNGNTLFRYFVEHDGVWNRANTASRILANGEIVNNFYDLPDLEESLLKSDAYIDGKSLDRDMASLISTTGLAREFSNGAQLFTDRQYMAHNDAILDALSGKSYFRNSIDSQQKVQVTKAGYVVIAAPATGQIATNIASYLQQNGFILLEDNLPVIGYNCLNANYIEEATNYYVKWCEIGENYTFDRWCICFFDEQEYNEDYWLNNAASVIKLDTVELREKYAPSTRLWQGIPSITTVEKKDGSIRLWACWFTGSDKEPRVGNYSVYYYSDDDGDNWTPAYVVTFNYDVVNDSRVYDPTIFTDNNNNLFLCWNQTNYSFSSGSVWYVNIKNAECDYDLMVAANPIKRSSGLAINKPVILSTGEWLFAAHDMNDRDKSKIYSSLDGGMTWSLKGYAEIHNSNNFFEPVIAEVVDDGTDEVTLMLWNRCTESYCISISYSYDGGVTWTVAEEFTAQDCLINGAASRMNALSFNYEGKDYIAYTQHYGTSERKDICLYLSDDGGKTFAHALILDSKTGVAYPDIRYVDGYLYVVWDYNRYSEKRIFMAKISIEELLVINGVTRLDNHRVKTVSSLTISDMFMDLGGTVTDENGNPISNVNVKIDKKLAITDSEGNFNFNNISAENITIIITADGYFTKTISIDKNMIIDSEFNLTQDVVLQKINEFNMSGILADRYGNVLSNVAVSIDDNTTYTDEYGFYEFNDIVPNQNKQSLLLKIESSINLEYSKEILYTTFNSENNYTLELDIVVLENNVTDLGVVGGVDGHAKYNLYLIRNKEEIVVEALTTTTLTTNGIDKLEIFLNVDEFNSVGGKSQRDGQFILFNIFSNGLIRGWNYPENTKTALFSEGYNNVTYKGVTINNTVVISDQGVNSIKFTIPYAFFKLISDDENSFEGISTKADMNAATPIGCYFMSGYKVGSTWSSYDNWSYKDSSGCNKNFPIDLAVAGWDNQLYKNYHSYVDQVLSSYELLDSYIAKSFGIGLSENMATFTGHSMKKYIAGNPLFSDRDAGLHGVPQDGGVGALSGLKYIYDPVVGDDTEITVTTSGYLLLLVDDNSIKNTNLNGWSFVARSCVKNHGIATSAGTASLYVIWINKGESVAVPANAVVFTK